MSDTAVTAVSSVLRIPTGHIRPGPNARGAVGDVDELAASLRGVGQQIPVVVEPAGDGRYQLLDGHRRHAAAVHAGLPYLDAVVRRPMTESARLIRQLAIQSHGRSFDPMAEARALHRLMFEHHLSREDIARQVGRTPAWVRDRISLVHLPAGDQRELEARRISVAEALRRVAARREFQAGRPPARRPRPVVAHVAAPAHQPPAPQPAAGICPTCNRPIEENE